MPTIGTTTKPTSYWWSVETGIEQIAEELVAPEALRILEVAQWVGGYNGTCRGHLCVWDADTNELLGNSAQVTVANGGGVGGAIVLVSEPLLVPVQVARDAHFRVGFQRHQNDGFTYFGANSGSGPHYEAHSGSLSDPSDFGAGAGDPVEVIRRIGAYVADYEPTPGAWVFRSGAWVRAEAVSVYRSGAWAEVDAVQIYRSGSWSDAE